MMKLLLPGPRHGELPATTLRNSNQEQHDPGPDDAANSWKLSVVIPTHNRAGLLNEAIASVLQSPLITAPEQVIVVDDDSHDQTPETIRQHGVSHVRVQFRNRSQTRNAGLALVRTPYVAFLDDDDAWLPENMQAQLAALESHPEAAFAYGIARCADESLQPLPWTFPSPPLASGLVPDRLHLAYPNLGVVLFRRQAVTDVGGFDPRIIYHQDGELMLRLAARHEIVGVDVVGMLYRVRAPSKARSDFFWANRGVTTWAPMHLGIGWKSAALFYYKTRGLFYSRFCEDAVACAALGQRHDAFQCLFRAVRVSPERALRQSPALLPMAWRCLLGIR